MSIYLNRNEGGRYNLQHHIYNRMVCVLIIAILLLTSASQSAAAQSIVLPKDSFYLSHSEGGYRIHVGTFIFSQSKSSVMLELQRNAAFIARAGTVAALLPVIDPVYVEITGTASAEGPLTINNRLATQRAEEMCIYLAKNIPHFAAQEFRINTKLFSWDELPGDVRQTAKGSTANLEQKYLAHQRGVHLSIVCRTIPAEFVQQLSRRDTIVVRQRDIVDIVRHDTITTVRRDTVYIDRRPTAPIRFVALKNNLLYDLALLPNIAVEASLGNRWSAVLDVTWSWWGSSKAYSDFVWRIQVAGVELRKWLGSSQTRGTLNGHYVGAYAMGGTYDVRLQNDADSKGYLSNESWSAGLTYGYAMPLSRRLNLEFAIGVGYAWGAYKVYDYGSSTKDYIYRKTAYLRWPGPTRATVALVWLIGNGTNR